MSLGDSITAAFGVHGLEGGLEEIRGNSFSIGANPNVTTLPNLLKYFNPDLIGASVGSHLVEFCYGPLCPPFQYHDKIDVFNGAQSGAMVENLPTHEFDYLHKQVTENKKINMAEDWKLLTLLIGANDLCASCTFAKPFLDPAEYEKHLMTTLTKVHEKFPRTFVQIVEMFNISQVYNLSLKSNACKDIHRAAFIECDCLFQPLGAKSRAEMDRYAQDFNARSRKVAAHFQGLNDPQFTVVTQPFGRDTSVASFPIEALSTLDCFHPSALAHEAMAINLWNSMLTPAAKKSTVTQLDAVPMCPTADTLIYAN
jgi:phospholipase B1